MNFQRLAFYTCMLLTAVFVSCGEYVPKSMEMTKEGMAKKTSVRVLTLKDGLYFKGEKLCNWEYRVEGKLHGFDHAPAVDDDEELIAQMNEGRVNRVLLYSWNSKKKKFQIKETVAYDFYKKVPTVRTIHYQDMKGEGLVPVRCEEVSRDAGGDQYQISLTYYKDSRNDRKKKQEIYLNGKKIVERKFGFNGNVIEEKLNGKKQELVYSGSYMIPLPGDKWNEVRFSNGKKTGKERIYDKEDRVLLEHDHENGFYREFYENGYVKLEIPIINGMRQGTGRGYRKNGKLRKELTYDQDSLSGGWVRFYESGTHASSGFIMNGKEMGPLELFYPSGKKKEYGEMEHKGADRFGKWQTWAEDGKKFEVYETRNGIKHGAYRKWDESGVLIEEGTYHKKSRHGKFVFNKDGKESIQFYSRGGKCSKAEFEKYNLEMKDFEENSVYEVVDGVKMKHVKGFYSNGKPGEDYYVLNGKKHGVYRSWNTRGSEKAKMYYYKGYAFDEIERYNCVLADGEFLKALPDDDWSEGINSFIYPSIDQGNLYDEDQVAFMINYPEGVEEDEYEVYNKDLDYISFSVGRGKNRESLRIGKVDYEIKKHHRQEDIERNNLNWESRVIRSLRTYGKDVKYHYTGRTVFYGKLVRINEYTVGKQKVVVMLYPTNKKNKFISLVFQAHVQHPEVQKFEDLGKKGVMGKIFRTLEFH